MSVALCTNCGKVLEKNQKKYCSIVCQREFEHKEWISDWLSGNISGTSKTDHWKNNNDHIRRYLFEKYNNKCSKCGWGEMNTYTNKIPLEMEHIDGDADNNRPENLDLLCPNCHSLTKTYRGANRGNGRPKTWVPK